MQPSERARRACVAFGYQCLREPARIDDPGPLRAAAAIEEFCRRRGWHLAALQRDIGPHPGKRPQQPALMHTIERLHDGEASCLVVARLSDLCPSVAELGGILDAVDRAEARLVSLDPAFDTGNLVGRAVVRMLTTVSGWERTRRAEMTAAARSKGGMAPEVPARLRRRIVQMRRTGLTLQAIADRLNEEGVPTVRGGALWRPSSVQATLGYKRPRAWKEPRPNGR